jgi:hypothetical protein
LVLCFPENWAIEESAVAIAAARQRWQKAFAEAIATAQIASQTRPLSPGSRF